LLVRAMVTAWGRVSGGRLARRLVLLPRREIDEARLQEERAKRR
jgi:hypothetical protein